MKGVNRPAKAAENVQSSSPRPQRKGTSASLLATFAGWMLLSALAVFIIWQIRDRARLVRDNENEQILGELFRSLMDHSDFGPAIVQNEMVIRRRITSFAVYDDECALIWRWGGAPSVFDLSLIEDQTVRRFNRYMILDKHGRSVTFVYRSEEPPSELPVPREWIGTAWLKAFSGRNYVYITISHWAYWRTVTITNILYPLSVLGLLVLALAVRSLYVRNLEYRGRIEAQQNLVVLGTAASTLAHEIKNPLHSIKLQTGILKKMLGENDPGLEEINHIDEELDRLSMLTYQINDYLRDAKGNPETIDLAEVIKEISIRLYGRSILDEASVLPEASAKVFMDSGRARSVFENIITNAMESGGPPEECGAVLEQDGNMITARIFDRGRGIATANLKRIFDPFFTTKSSGTGIGLVVSRRFLEAAGGSISVENRPDGGALVKVVLPCAS